MSYTCSLYVFAYVCVLFTCVVNSMFQAVGYGLVLLDGNIVNINKLKKFNLARVDRLFKVRVATCVYTCVCMSVYVCVCVMVLVVCGGLLHELYQSTEKTVFRSSC